MSSVLPPKDLMEIDYPSSDGKPMGETPLHRRVINDSIVTLDAWYIQEPMVYVSGDMLLYYVEGDPKKFVVPDVMVVKGIPKDARRDIYQTWKEKTPDAIIEVTSRKTAKKDQNFKCRFYETVLKVGEYFMFDPTADYLKPVLKGFRLEKGEYQPIKEVANRLPSEVLGLHLEANLPELRFYDPAAGKWLPSPQEVRTALEQQRLALEQERRAREQERLALEQERRAFEQERSARARAEAEVERLRKELEARS